MPLYHRMTLEASPLFEKPSRLSARSQRGGQRKITLRGLAPAEFAEDTLVQTSCERKASIRGIQQGRNALGELRRIAAIDQNAVPVLANEFRHPVDTSGDDRQSEDAGLQQHERK